MGRVVLDPSISDADLRAAIYRQVLSEEDLAAAVDDADRIMRPLDDDYFDLLADRYSHLRQFAPSLLGAFNFRSSDVDQELVEAIELVRRLNASGRRKVPENAPVSFVPARWRTYAIDDDAESIAVSTSFASCGNCVLRCEPATSGWRAAVAMRTLKPI